MVLSQQVQGTDRPVLYISQKLSGRELRYSAIQKECSVRCGITCWGSRSSSVQTTLPSSGWGMPESHITCWYLELQPFKCRVVHKPGAQMTVVDFLCCSHGEGRRGG